MKMFQKKDIIFSETLGVCKVEDITRLSLTKGDMVSYYILRSVSQKEKIAYIPVEHHEVVLRELLTVEEAREKKQEMETTEKKYSEPELQELGYLLTRQAVK